MFNKKTIRLALLASAAFIPTLALAEARPAETVTATAAAPDAASINIDAIVVTANAAPTVLNAVSTAGGRLGLTALQTPASVEILTGDVVRLRGDFSFVEAASRAAGVTQVSLTNGGSFAARGFSGNNSVMRLFDGVRLYVTGGTVSFPFDTWSAERIEVLRGAASVIYGEGAIGAAIDVIPKKPVDEPIHTQIRLIGGSEATTREAIDSGGSITDKLSYRADISNNKSAGWVKDDDPHSLAISGALKYNLTPRLNVTLASDYGNQRPTRNYGLPLINGQIDPDLRYTNFNVADGHDQFIETWTRLNEDWQPTDNISVKNTSYYLTTHRTFHNDVRVFVFNPSNNTVSRGGCQNLYYQMEQEGDHLDVAIRGSLFGLKNTFTLGVEYNQLHYFRSVAFNGTTSVVPAFTYVPSPLPAVKSADTERYKTWTDTRAGFMDDRLELNDQFSVVAGLRYDHMDLNHQTQNLAPAINNFVIDLSKPTGRIGLIYEPTKATSIYAQFSQAVDPLSDLANLSFINSHFQLATGKQYEIGLKHEFDGGKGEFTTAIYQIHKYNLLIQQNPVGISSDPDTFANVGEQSSHGIEAALGYAFTKTFRVDANGSILQAKFDDFQEVVSGKIVSRDGNVPIDVPEQSANLGATWQFLPKWQVMANLRYVGKRYLNNADSAVMP